MLNTVFLIGFIVVSIGGFVSGIVKHQPSLLIAGGCFVAIGIIGLLTKQRATIQGSGDEVFFLIDFGSPLRSIPCLILLIAAIAAFFIFPPNHPYW